MIKLRIDIDALSDLVPNDAMNDAVNVMISKLRR